MFQQRFFHFVTLVTFGVTPIRVTVISFTYFTFSRLVLALIPYCPIRVVIMAKCLRVIVVHGLVSCLVS